MAIILPKGTTNYQEMHNGVSIIGISYSDNQVKQYSELVKNACFDSDGQDELNAYISSIGETGFTSTQSILTNIKEWQLGEALAEVHLEQCFSCHFPWSNRRDLKNPKSSLSGADLVGYHNSEFAFGEVKTSAEQKSPPQVTSKRYDGLSAQLNKLCIDTDLRQTIIQYLFFRQKETVKYQEALRTYLKNQHNFYIFGVLVRNTLPNVNDWSYLKNNFTAHKKNKSYLVALYLSFDKLRDCVTSGGES
ncbi:MAG: hypothetical protein HFP81_06800 [Methylococcales symbiont of Hymedesmia sp. n. MRB-2018]|nr:MAG: hypothetical protein HFP81_06800 [Methylococcales symbiont of Hymedesmia sp. n. MRB-2018]